MSVTETRLRTGGGGRTAHTPEVHQDRHEHAHNHDDNGSPHCCKQCTQWSHRASEDDKTTDQPAAPSVAAAAASAMMI